MWKVRVPDEVVPSLSVWEASEEVAYRKADKPPTGEADDLTARGQAHNHRSKSECFALQVNQENNETIDNADMQDLGGCYRLICPCIELSHTSTTTFHQTSLAPPAAAPHLNACLPPTKCDYRAPVFPQHRRRLSSPASCHHSRRLLRSFLILELCSASGYKVYAGS